MRRGAVCEGVCVHVAMVSARGHGVTCIKTTEVDRKTNQVHLERVCHDGGLCSEESAE